MSDERRVMLTNDDYAHIVKEIRPFGGMGDTVFTRCGKMRLVAFTAPAPPDAPNCEACDVS